MNDPQNVAGINVRSPHYFIARTRAVCRHCGESTELFALALPPGHETLVVGDDDELGHAAEDWSFAIHHALLFHIEFLNAVVAAKLANCTRTFRLVHQYPGACPAWSNHCEACGSRLDDEELFCEPGEAFFPISESVATAIRLLRIDDTLEAAAGGYFFDPDFFPAIGLE
jgi:hypothetical protein